MHCRNVFVNIRTYSTNTMVIVDTLKPSCIFSCIQDIYTKIRKQDTKTYTKQINYYTNFNEVEIVAILGGTVLY